jgi:transcriptional regulator with XRE-family HTH domain
MNDWAMTEGDREEIAEQIRAFGQNLREARQRAGVTQVELSCATGRQRTEVTPIDPYSTKPVDRAAISRLECGERAPDLPTLMRLCAALDTQPTALVRGIGAEAPLRRIRRKPVDEGRAAQFGTNLKWARQRAGVSQERLALNAKVDRAAISVYENGGREPNLRTVLKLAYKLDIRPAALLAGIE